MHLSRWVLLAMILLLVVVLGFFLPPVSIILMTAPIILPPLKAAGFDLDLVRHGDDDRDGDGAHSPAGRAEIFVIRNIAPDIPLGEVIWGIMPFVGLMIFAIVLLCIAPPIATWLPDVIMGAR